MSEDITKHIAPVFHLQVADVQEDAISQFEAEMEKDRQWLAEQRAQAQNSDGSKQLNAAELLGLVTQAESEEERLERLNKEADQVNAEIEADLKAKEVDEDEQLPNGHFPEPTITT